MKKLSKMKGRTARTGRDTAAKFPTTSKTRFRAFDPVAYAAVIEQLG